MFSQQPEPSLLHTAVLSSWSTSYESKTLPRPTCSAVHETKQYVNQKWRRRNGAQLFRFVYVHRSCCLSGGEGGKSIFFIQFSVVMINSALRQSTNTLCSMFNYRVCRRLCTIVGALHTMHVLAQCVNFKRVCITLNKTSSVLDPRVGI